MTAMELKRGKIRALKKEDDLPGYPLYAPEDDIMNRAVRVEGDLDDEMLTTENSRKPTEVLGAQDKTTPERSDELIKPSASDVTKEDLEALGPKDLSLDMNDDEQLKHRTTPVDFTGGDLDIPGAELDDASEDIGSEDEENNGYSIGGDNHGDLEESRP